MGKKDDTMYDYLEKPDKFADLVNVVLFQGQQVIDSSMLEPDDTRYVTKTRKKGGKPKMNNRYRDLKKRLVNGVEIGIIAIENQETVDYTMPLRIMEYDCLEYRKQVEQIRLKKVQKLKEQNQKPSDLNTRLEVFDKLNPVQTICLYHGADEWRGPESLKDMVNFDDVLLGWENRFNDYRMTLFCANRVQDFSMFKTELGQLLQAISCTGDKKKLQVLFQEEKYRHLERETAEAIAIMTDVDALLKRMDEYKEDGGYDMCKGMDDWAKEEQEKGKAEGKIENLLQNIQALMKNLKITAEEAMETLDVPVEERAEYLAML